jgi:hypothetical protein
MFTETTVRTFTVACDGPALGANCPTLSISSPTDAGLLKIMRAQGWRLPDVDGDGKIDQATPCYCGPCEKALEAARKLGPR